MMPFFLQAQGLQLKGNAQMNMQPNSQITMLTGSQTLDIDNGATLRGVGTITGNVTNKGTLSAGTPTGTLTINGVLDNQGLIEAQLQGTGAGQYDLITVNGTANIAGTVEVIYLGGYTLPTATTLDIITTTGLAYSATEISPPTAPILDNATTVYLGLGVFLSVGNLVLNAERTDAENVQVHWTTSQEQNNRGFEVQTSPNGSSFEAVGFVEGRGNTNSMSSYNTSFMNPNDVYVRLKQVDFDGKFSYSPVVFVKGSETLKIYPNPSQGTFTVEAGKAKERVPIKILTMQGIEIWQNTLPESNTGKHTLQTNLPTGTYILQVLKAGKWQTHKIIIER